MGKSLIVITVYAIMLMLLIACAPAPMTSPVSPTAGPTSAAPVAAFPVTITDDAGRQVTIQAAPKRIVSLAPSNTEVVYSLGEGAVLVGVTEYCDYPPEAKDKPKVGGYAKIDLEKVVGLEPDLILATSIHDKDIVPELAKRGLTVVVIEPKNVDDVLSRIALVGKITGASDQAVQLNAQLKSRVDAVTSKVTTAKTKPRVFYEINKTLFTPGPGSFIDDMIAKAGGTNIAADAKSAYPQLTPELIIARDPEIIFLGDMFYGESPESVKQRPGWSNLTAVKAGRILPLVDDDLFSRSGPRVVDGIEWLARSIHPDLFR